MKKMMLAAAAAIMIASPAHASGWVREFDCGSGVMVNVTDWHGKMFLGVRENGKDVVDNERFYDAGIDALEEKPEKLNADESVFRFRLKLHGKTVIARYHQFEKFTLSGHVCESHGDPRYKDVPELWWGPKEDAKVKTTHPERRN
jgi:hypothetical protein